MKKKLIVVLAICLAAALILAGCKGLKKQDENTNKSTEPESTVQIANPVVEYDSLAKAEKAVGFTMKLPSELGTLKLKYTVIDGKLLEACGEMNGKEVVVRKALGSEDISGDYNSYEKEVTIDLSSCAVTMKGNADGFCLATWTQNGYSYSISTPAISDTALATLVAQVQ